MDPVRAMKSPKKGRRAPMNVLTIRYIPRKVNRDSKFRKERLLVSVLRAGHSLCAT
jgi:hypothetical protein